MELKKKVRLSICFLACVAFLVIGCAPSASIEATASVTPFRTTVSSPPTNIPPRTSTLVPSPTATPISVDTWSSASPDGKWNAQGLMRGPFAEGDEEKYYTQLKVVSADGTVEWTVVDKTSHYGLGYTTPRPFHWSRDGQYLYYTDFPIPDGCAIFVNAWGLYRVDLTDGRVTEIVKPEAWWLSMSPDEATLASIIWNGHALEVGVRDLATGSERRTELDAKYSQAGAIVWSPDHKAFILAADQNPCDPANWTRSFVRVDIATLSQTNLIRDNPLNFSIMEWPEAGRVLLSDKDGNRWWMDAMTGQVTPVK